MGGMAMTRSIKEAALSEGVREVPVVLLLDRRADAFLAKRAAAAAWLQKPFNSYELRNTVDRVIGAEEASREA